VLVAAELAQFMDKRPNLRVEPHNLVNRGLAGKVGGCRRDQRLRSVARKHKASFDLAVMVSGIVSVE